MGPGRCHIDPVAGETSLWLARQRGLLGWLGHSQQPVKPRFAQIDLRATSVAGLVVLVTLIVAWLVAIARGQNGHPYDWLLAVSGLTYVLAIAFFRWRG